MSLATTRYQPSLDNQTCLFVTGSWPRSNQEFWLKSRVRGEQVQRILPSIAVSFRQPCILILLPRFASSASFANSRKFL
ncbi:hypothetical protein vseg_012155 [Gypsophila vaccaria]